MRRHDEPSTSIEVRKITNGFVVSFDDILDIDELSRKTIAEEIGLELEQVPKVRVVRREAYAQTSEQIVAAFEKSLGRFEMVCAAESETEIFRELSQRSRRVRRRSRSRDDL